MNLLGHDIFITTRNPMDTAAAPRQFFSWHQGDTINDTEIYWGNREVIISRLPATAT